MKNLILILTIMVFSCSPGSYSSNHQVSKNIVQKNEEKDEYEVIIIDNGFTNWMASNSKSINYYSDDYYRQKNIFYAASWNEKVTQRSRYRSKDYPFEEHINYDASIDYGIELNYQLFWYFKYVESVYGKRFGFPN